MRSRADLRRVNALMGNARIIARHLGQASRIADLGGGDGSLMRAVARKLGRGLEVTNVDRIAGREVFEFLAAPGRPLDAIVANLFLHHLTQADLRRLFRLAAQRAPLFVACEPRRSRFALAGSRLMWSHRLQRRHAPRRGDQRARRLQRRRAVGGMAEARELDAERARRAPFSQLFVARRNAAI